VFLAGEAMAASAAEWVFLGEGQSGDAWHVDKKSIGRVSKQSVRAWIKAELTRPNILQARQPLRQSSLIEWQCPEMKHRTIETVIQFTDGSKSTVKGTPVGALAPPSIVLDSLYLYLCSGDAGCEWKSPGCPE
jgi:hypothetical protein